MRNLGRTRFPFPKILLHFGQKFREAFEDNFVASPIEIGNRSNFTIATTRIQELGINNFERIIIQLASSTGSKVSELRYLRRPRRNYLGKASAPLRPGLSFLKANILSWIYWSAYRFNPNLNQTGLYIHKKGLRP